MRIPLFHNHGNPLDAVSHPYQLNLESLKISPDVTIPPILLTAETSDLTATIEAKNFIGSFH